MRDVDIPDTPDNTFIDPREATLVVNLFLHDYDVTRILSFCGGIPVVIMTQQDVWSHNKRAIVDYVPKGKDLKLIWESDPKTQRIIRMFHTLRDLGTADSILFLFGGRASTFYVMNITIKNIHQVHDRVRALPPTPPRQA